MSDDEFGPEHEYFHAIEDLFITRRGAPLTLQPKDFLVASEWFAAGIPLPLVLNAVNELFDEREAREDGGTVLSLKACGRRVLQRWREFGVLAAVASPSFEADSHSSPSGGRLRELAEGLPADLPERERWSTVLLAIEPDQEWADVELALQSLERELLDWLEQGLATTAREAVAQKVDRALQRSGAGNSSGSAGSARRALMDQELRRRFGLARLSVVD